MRPSGRHPSVVAAPAARSRAPRGRAGRPATSRPRPAGRRAPRRQPRAARPRRRRRRRRGRGRPAPPTAAHSPHRPAAAPPRGTTRPGGRSVRYSLGSGPPQPARVLHRSSAAWPPSRSGSVSPSTTSLATSTSASPEPAAANPVTGRPRLTVRVLPTVSMPQHGTRRRPGPGPRPVPRLRLGPRRGRNRARRGPAGRLRRGQPAGVLRCAPARPRAALAGQRSVIVSYNGFLPDQAQLRDINGYVAAQLGRLSQGEVRRSSVPPDLRRQGHRVRARRHRRAVDGGPVDLRPDAGVVHADALRGGRRRDAGQARPSLGLVVVGQATRTDRDCSPARSTPAPACRCCWPTESSGSRGFASLERFQRSYGWVAPVDLGRVRRDGVPAYLDSSASVADRLDAYPGAGADRAR